jgi:small conductance mechanosensitive channel
MDQEIEQVTALYQSLVSFVVNYSFQLFGAVVILLIGIFIARKIATLILKVCLKHELDQTLSNFIASFIRIAVIVMVGIMALNKLGISVTPLLATVGALSLGAGLAVQGLVSNYGAGLNIIVARPFVVGDTIEVNDVKGIVTEVHLGFTLLVDEDDIQILVPNRHIVGEVIKNSKQDMLIESTIGLSYGQSPQQAIDIINGVIEQSTLLSSERASKVGVGGFADSSITLNIRLWAPTEHHHQTRFEINLAIYEALLAAKINIPFPQREVHLNHLSGKKSQS